MTNSQAQLSESLARRVHGAGIANAMVGSGLPVAFVIKLLDLIAQEHRSVYELMALWEESAVDEDRNESVADLQEILDDLEHAGPVAQKPHLPFERLSAVAKTIQSYKAKLRSIIDRHGGVSRVAELSGIPQPSLSRMLNSASMPRKTTLFRIANALGLPETDIVTEYMA